MKKILLIIDDDKMISEALSEQFNQSNKDEIEILIANDGEEGLKVAFKHHPDLILLDLIMPKMDGITMLDKLRRDEWGKTAEVIILSNLDDVEKVAEVLERETYEYLAKINWDIAAIVKKIKDKLGLK